MNMFLIYAKKIYIYIYIYTLKNIYILLKAFVESQFGYCPLIWMFHGIKSNSIRNATRYNNRDYLLHLTSF